MRQCLISLLIEDSAKEMKSGIVAVRSSRFKKLAMEAFNSVNVEIAIVVPLSYGLLYPKYPIIVNAIK